MINKNDNPAFTDLRVCPSLAHGMSPSCCNLSHVTCTPTKNNYNANISWILGLYQAPVIQKVDNALDWINNKLFSIQGLSQQLYIVKDFSGLLAAGGLITNT